MMVFFMVIILCRFWKCKIEKTERDGKHDVSYEWAEWEMFRKDKESVIEIQGKLLSC